MSNSEHAVDRNRRRAEAVHALLLELWGNDLPPGPSPQVAALIDALVGDDHFGRVNGYLVHGDQVSYEAVATLIRLCRTPEIVADLLGPALLTRIAHSVDQHPALDIEAWTDPDLRSPALGTLDPDTNAGTDVGSSFSTSPPGRLSDMGGQPGAWYLDAREQTLSWDGACAQLLQRPASVTHCTVDEELGRTHPDDRETIARSWRRCIEAGEPHQVWFRTCTPAGEYRAYRAIGRRVLDGVGRVHVVGFLHADR